MYIIERITEYNKEKHIINPFKFYVPVLIVLVVYLLLIFEHLIVLNHYVHNIILLLILQL